MSEVLQTPNGSVTILSKYDLIDLIRSYISDDVANYVEKNFKDYDTEEELNEKRFKSDFNAIEMSCDAYTAALNEITFICKDLQCMLEQKRLDRNKLQEKAHIIENTALEVL